MFGTNIELKSALRVNSKFINHHRFHLHFRTRYFLCEYVEQWKAHSTECHGPQALWYDREQKQITAPGVRTEVSSLKSVFLQSRCTPASVRVTDE
jgi:hypothetical protein